MSIFRFLFLDPFGDIIVVSGSTFFEAKRSLRRTVGAEPYKHYDYSLVGTVEVTK